MRPRNRSCPCSEKPIEAGLAPMFALDDVARHAIDFWLSTENLPKPGNRVTFERDGSVKLSYTPNNQVPRQKLFDKLKSLLNHLGHPRGRSSARNTKVAPR